MVHYVLSGCEQFDKFAYERKKLVFERLDFCLTVAQKFKGVFLLVELNGILKVMKTLALFFKLRVDSMMLLDIFVDR